MGVQVVRISFSCCDKLLAGYGVVFMMLSIIVLAWDHVVMVCVLCARFAIHLWSSVVIIFGSFGRHWFSACYE